MVALLLIAAGAAASAYVGWDCMRRTYCVGPAELLGTAVLAVLIAAWVLLPGSDRISADEQALVVYRKHVPWAAIRTMAWGYEPRGKALLPRIEIGLRDVAGYKSPRAGRLMIDPADLDMSPDAFWEMVQERAKPHHVIVLSTPPATPPLG